VRSASAINLTNETSFNPSDNMIYGLLKRIGVTSCIYFSDKLGKYTPSMKEDLNYFDLQKL
jgi:hypothetical protein